MYNPSHMHWVGRYVNLSQRCLLSSLCRRGMLLFVHCCSRFVYMFQCNMKAANFTLLSLSTQMIAVCVCVHLRL